MLKKNLKILIITSIITVLPVLAGIILWDKLPEQIPTHWNMAGEVDGWSSKAFGVFGLPLILLGVQLLMLFGISSDPKKQNHYGKMLFLSFWLVPVLSVVLSVITYATALGGDFSINMFLPVVVGLPLVIIGNYLPKCKQNYTIGIKIPWTLNSEENWNKTHRMAGWLWVLGGIVIMLSGFIDIVWIMVPIFFVMALVPMIYSYVLHRKSVKKEDKNNG